MQPIEIAPDDPIVAHLLDALGAVNLTHLDLDSPALAEMRASGVALVVPLVVNGELIGLLSVGRRLSDQDYSADDRRLLERLAAQAAPAVRVGQLVRAQQAEIRARGRARARAGGRQADPAELPTQAAARSSSAGRSPLTTVRRARSAATSMTSSSCRIDRIGLVIGDVTDKGVPAAMVMAATRSVLRDSAQRLSDPGAVLARVNDNLCPDIPPHMFVTCFYGVLDPASGDLRYANAGHNVPLVRSGAERSELRATGMPLGLMPGMQLRGAWSDRRPGRERAALQRRARRGARLRARDVRYAASGRDTRTTRSTAQPLIDALLLALDAFTEDAQEQEDDITLVVVQRAATTSGVLADFTSYERALGNEREATRRVADAAAVLGLTA